MPFLKKEIINPDNLPTVRDYWKWRLLMEEYPKGSEMPAINDTTTHFWDCECDNWYIHTALEDECPVCHAKRDEMSDAMVVEIYDRVREAEALWLIMKAYSPRISVNQYCWVVYDETALAGQRWQIYRQQPWKESQLTFEASSLVDVLRNLFENGDLDPLKE